MKIDDFTPVDGLGGCTFRNFVTENERSHRWDELFTSVGTGSQFVISFFLCLLVSEPVGIIYAALVTALTWLEMIHVSIKMNESVHPLLQKLAEDLECPIYEYDGLFNYPCSAIRNDDNFMVITSSHKASLLAYLTIKVVSFGYNLQDFLLAHELGHIYNCDMYISTRKLIGLTTLMYPFSSIVYRFIPQEFRADRFARRTCKSIKKAGKHDRQG